MTESANGLPSWMPLAAWDAYVEMRKKIRRPMTERAKELAVLRLDKLRQAGHDPEAVLDQSVFNSWQGLFPLHAEVVQAGTAGPTWNDLEVRERRRRGGA